MSNFGFNRLHYGSVPLDSFPNRDNEWVPKAQVQKACFFEFRSSSLFRISNFEFPFIISHSRRPPYFRCFHFHHAPPFRLPERKHLITERRLRISAAYNPPHPMMQNNPRPQPPRPRRPPRRQFPPPPRRIRARA